MNRFATSALILTVCSSPLLAGKVKTVTVSAPAHYEKARLEQAVVSSEGRIGLGRWLKPFPHKGPLDAARVWDVVEDKTGNLFVATGDDGKIFKITASGEVSLAFNSQDSQVLCLLAGADGSIYAGTGPSGRIVRIDPTGNAKVIYDTPKSYIWSLAFDEKDQALFAATGPKGRIYKVAADGKADVFFQCKQDHVLCLARAADGTIYAGTDKQGLVYRVDAKGKGYVLFQAAQAEVRCLQLTDKALYVGTSSPSSGRPGGTTAGGSSIGGGGLTARPKSEPDKASSEEKGPVAAPGGRDTGRDADRPTSASGPSTPLSGENSVYRIGFDGSARELFREKGMVLSLLNLQDRMFIGTGSKGQLYEVQETTKERSEIARLDSGQIQRLYPRRDGSVLLAAGDPGKLYVLQDRYANSGSLIGEVIDAKLISRWGTLSWQADVPAGTKLSLAVRGGNVGEPDDTWTDWSAEQVDPKNALAGIPATRYAQFRVTLTTTDAAVTPTLSHLSLRYASLNQAPEVASLDVPSTEAVAASKEPKKMKFKWSATDANEDELTFDLYVRKDGWKDWVRVEEAWAKTEYDWDTTTMPSGMYRFRVVASDRPDNNEEDALTGERISGPVAVAHEAPAVTLKLAGIEKNKAAFEASASSSLVRLSGATFALNGGKWSNLYPTDNLFDSKDEKFRFNTESLSPGTHVMVLRVRDAAGNVGSADVVFTVPKQEK